MVSIIENGAGSVEVSARPALPKTRSTSGNDLQHAVLRLAAARCACVTEIPGSVVGM